MYIVLRALNVEHDYATYASIRRLGGSVARWSIQDLTGTLVLCWDSSGGRRRDRPKIRKFSLTRRRNRLRPDGTCPRVAGVRQEM